METLRDRIIRHEGVLLHPYKDSLGKLTIGVGRCLDTRGITEQEAMTLLDNDLQAVAQEVAHALPWATSIDAVRLSILQEMAFQLGIAGLLAFNNMLAALQNKDYVKAAYEMVSSQWAKQTPARVKELADLMLKA